ncbi:MAG: DUF2242 domain-containing protein [Betaproteobacteria bacterium]
MIRTLGLLVLASALLGACSTTKPPRAYQAEAFQIDTPFQYYSSREPEGACEIGKRALLSQGYLLEETKALSIRGEKLFQQGGEQVTKLSITLACLPSSLGAVIYANAMETHFELKSRGNSASVGVSGFGSLSLPWSAEKDTLTKTGESTVTEAGFYQRLFDLIKAMEG